MLFCYHSLQSEQSRLSTFLEAPRESGASLASAILLVVVVVIVVVVVVVLVVVLQVQPFLNNFGTTGPILKILSVLESSHQLIRFSSNIKKLTHFQESK